MKIDIPDFLIRQIPGQMVEDPETGWRRSVIYLGPTYVMSELCIHAGVLSGHVTPHPPHCHGHEEIHIALSDNLEFLGCEEASEIIKTKRVERNSLFFVDARRSHSFRNSTSKPASYLHMRWRNETQTVETEMELLSLYYVPGGPGGISVEKTDKGAEVIEIYAGPSRYLNKFRALFITLKPGGVIPLHRHPHEVIFALLRGSVEILGRKVDAPCVAFIGTRTPHGITNHGTETAQIYGFEFHS